MLTTVLLSMGSNIDPEQNLPAAAQRLARQVEVVAASRVFETAAAGAAGTAPFLNAALMIRTPLTAADLKFQVLRPLEAGLGRVRTHDRNAPRTIDLDISLFGDQVIDDPGHTLRIPDPEILTCGHVAIPLADVAPDTVHPETGERLDQIANRLREPRLMALDQIVLWPSPGGTSP